MSYRRPLESVTWVKRNARRSGSGIPPRNCQRTSGCSSVSLFMGRSTRSSSPCASNLSRWVWKSRLGVTTACAYPSRLMGPLSPEIDDDHGQHRGHQKLQQLPRQARAEDFAVASLYVGKRGGIGDLGGFELVVGTHSDYSHNAHQDHQRNSQQWSDVYLHARKKK